ncbi:Uncharacterized protein OBRU01_01555 [Operophtera brumata]|uniref:Uncharacterized protein n=1 Tax=Operophtera brumata TaxID=104452 RepID=A0A0L7LL48_OPEBR|nr:Uncharacterized protein OBRU01_01555 [Operophtera brumata]
MTTPEVVGLVSAAQLRQWARGGPDSKLERLVLAGQGRRLLAEAEALPLSHHLPALDLLEADYNRRKFVTCRDEAGVGLLHKAVFYDFMDIAEYLVSNFPQLVHIKDSVSSLCLK